MIAVIFEVWPNDERASEYFDLAAELRPQLAQIDGFISIERFESLATPGKFLSLSYWRDEDAIAAWRNLKQHRAAQAKGRHAIFSDYRIRVASVLRDYGMHERSEVLRKNLRLSAWIVMTDWQRNIAWLRRKRISLIPQ
ncbi:MAG: antibiotic biosynthesis monooxygenase [Gammaproteobacteria bacterium]